MTAQPRAIGRTAIAAGAGDRLTDLYQQGSARIMLPRLQGPGLQGVIVNTAGGITGGDRFTHAGTAGPGAHLVLTTQTAERLYRAQPDQTGRLEVTLTLDRGARLDWLPQETILFDACALDRSLTVDMAPDARLTAVEAMILGRAAMGETLRSARFRDDWRVRVGGRLAFADALRLQGDPTAMTAGPGTLGGMRAFATLLHIAPDAETRLAPLRAALGPMGGASLRDGCLVARLAAADGLALRRVLIDSLQCLLGGDLPRVWHI